MRQTPAREELLTALQAVREAIDIPHAATAGDAEIRAQILYERLLHAVVFLDSILGDPRDHGTVDIGWSVQYLREQLAKHPAEGYKTWDELQAELARQPALPARRPDARASEAAQPRTRVTGDGRPRSGHRPGRPAPGGEPWTCRGCGRQFTGRRRPGDLCTRCIREARS